MVDQNEQVPAALVDVAVNSHLTPPRFHQEQRIHEARMYPVLKLEVMRKIEIVARGPRQELLGEVLDLQQLPEPVGQADGIALRRKSIPSQIARSHRHAALRDGQRPDHSPDCKGVYTLFALLAEHQSHRVIRLAENVDNVRPPRGALRHRLGTLATQ